MNLSPIYSAAALFLTGLRLVARCHGAVDPREKNTLGLLIGLVGAALLALRLHLLLPLMVVGIAVAIGWRNDRAALLWPTLAAGVGATIGSIGWAVALWRSSGTFIFPLMPGTLRASWPGYRDPAVRSLGDYWDRLVAVLDHTPTLVALAGIVTLGWPAWRRRDGSDDLTFASAVVAFTAPPGPCSERSLTGGRSP